MNITVVQPAYFAGENPDEKISRFLLNQLENAAAGGLMVLPEYSNAGGLSDKRSELEALPRAQTMLKKASETAKEKGAYVAVNVLKKLGEKIKNSTYFLAKTVNVNLSTTSSICRRRK